MKCHLWPQLYLNQLLGRLDFSKMLIKVDDIVSTPAVRALIALHVEELNRLVPESDDVLDVSSLQATNVTLFSAWEGEELLGCGALKELLPTHGEIKSMRTVEAHMRKGVGKAILQHLISVAKRRGYSSLSLETGKDPPFQSARDFYSTMGFRYCEPYGNLPPCPQSSFMTMDL